MTPTADIIRELLLITGHGVTGVSTSWSVFVGFIPVTPDNALCVYATAGKLDGRAMSTGEQIEHPGIQVLVRGVSYRSTHKKAREIAAMFDQQRRSSVALDSEDVYILHNVSRSGAVLPLGMEEEGDRRRHLFTINATITVTKEP